MEAGCSSESHPAGPVTPGKSLGKKPRGRRSTVVLSFAVSGIAQPGPRFRPCPDSRGEAIESVNDGIATQVELAAPDDSATRERDSRRGALGHSRAPDNENRTRVLRQSNARSMGREGAMISGVERSPTTLADRYELIEVVGRGGMGEVWARRDLRLGRNAAVKLLEQATGVGGSPDRTRPPRPSTGLPPRRRPGRGGGRSERRTRRRAFTSLLGDVLLAAVGPVPAVVSVGDGDRRLRPRRSLGHGVGSRRYHNGGGGVGVDDLEARGCRGRRPGKRGRRRAGHRGRRRRLGAHDECRRLIRRRSGANRHHAAGGEHRCDEGTRQSSHVFMVSEAGSRSVAFVSQDGLSADERPSRP